MPTRLGTHGTEPVGPARSSWLARRFNPAPTRGRGGGRFVGAQVIWFGTAVAVMGIAFGLWWAVFALLELRLLRRSGGLPFHIGWWSFVFPTAAVALSIGAVGDATGLLAVQVLAAIAAFALACVWAMVATRTLMAVHEQGRAARS